MNTTLLQVDKNDLRDIVREMVEEFTIKHDDDVATAKHAADDVLIYGIKGLANYLQVSIPTARKLRDAKLFPQYSHGHVIIFKACEVLNGMGKRKR